MGLKVGLHLLQQTGKAVANYADDAARLVAKNGDDAVGIFCRKPVAVNPAELKGLRFAPEAIGDTVKFGASSATKTLQTQGTRLADEITTYINAYKQKGELFIPTNLNTSSPTFKFIEYCKQSKIEPTVKNYQNFLFGSWKLKLNCTREEILKLCELRGREIAEELRNVPGINPKIIEKAPQIEQWSQIIYAAERKGYSLTPEACKLLQDDALYKQAVREFEHLAKEMTGKKVLLVPSDDLAFLPSAVLSLGNPKVHQGVEYIILGHGTGSSLITNTLNPNTWRFDATNQSVWEFIEKNIPKGNKCAICVCEENGLELAGKTLTEMVDKKGQIMHGIGKCVWTTGFPQAGPLKYCESGIRHITGHATGKEILKTFCDLNQEWITRDWEIVNYAL